MEGGEEGAGFDEEGAVGDLLDAAGDAEAVELACAEGFEDEEVEGSLEEVGLALHGLLSIRYTSVLWVVSNVNRSGDMRGKCAVGLGVSLERGEKSGRVRTTKRGERRKKPCGKRRRAGVEGCSFPKWVKCGLTPVLRVRAQSGFY